MPFPQRAFPARAATSRSRLPNCTNAQIRQIDLSSSVAASLYQAHLPLSDASQPANPLPLTLPLPPMQTVATHKQRHGELSTYTLAGTVGIGVCLLSDKPLGDEGKEG